MKRIIYLISFLFFISHLHAQLLFTDSTLLSTDGGSTFQLNSVGTTYHDATHCRIAYLYGRSFDNTTQQLKNSSYETLSYDNNGNVIQEIEQLWNGNTYVNYLRISYTYYNSTSKYISILTETWNNAIWIDSTLATYTYDANAYVIDYLNQNWNKLLNAFQKKDEIVYYNNVAGSPDSSVHLIYQNNTPLPDYKDLNTYNASDTLLTQQIRQTYVNNNWQNSTRTTNTYDPSGNLIYYIVESYLNNQWQYSGRGTTTYYVKGKPAMIASDYYSQISLLWTPLTRQTFIYNAAGNPIQHNSSNYLTGTNLLLDSVKVLTSYVSCSLQSQQHVQLCSPTGNTILNAGITGTTFQWQLSTDSVNFSNISNNSNYNGTQSSTLNLSNIPSSWYGYEYRCIVNGQTGGTIIIEFADTWTGATSNIWNVSSNWSCGKVPDINTDVIINSGNVLLNSNTSVRSVIIANSLAALTVGSNVHLTITH